MKPLYSEQDFNQAKSTYKLPCECYQCKNIFYKEKKIITYHLKHPNNTRYSIKYCSKICESQNRKTKIEITCNNCHTKFHKNPSEIKRTKNHFCCKSCSATYNNKHKTMGSKRSKLELWIEQQLTLLYPNLKIDYNKSTAIGSELDIYIPSLNIAFELNGIFHYEPIYGINKLNQIKINDAKIDLCIIDTSSQKYVKPSTSQKYLDIILNIIKERLSII